MTSTSKNRTNSKTDKKMKPRATEQPTDLRQSLRTEETRTQNHNLGLATPDKGFPKGNCPASERKPRSSAQKRLDSSKARANDPPHENKRKTTHSRKGALTTARPQLVNACLTGETCAKHFADICYTASGLRAETQLHPTKRNIKAEWDEWATECATHIFPSKN